MRSILACLVTWICFLGAIGGTTGATPDEHRRTSAAIDENLNFQYINNMRNESQVSPKFIYDENLTAGNAATFVVEEISKKFNAKEPNNSFWKFVVTYWQEKETEFEASLWSTKDESVAENVKAAQYLLYVYSPQTGRVFIKNEMTFHGGLTKRNKHKVVTYFSPAMPVATMNAALAFKYIDALHLLNSFRRCLEAPPLDLKPEMCDKAKLLLQEVKNQASEAADSMKHRAIAARVFRSSSENVNMSNVVYFDAMVKPTKDYSVFAYRIPNTADLTQLRYKFLYAAFKEVLFSAYADSFIKFEDDAEFYAQIKTEITKFLESTVREIGLATEIFTRKQQRYAIIVAYFGEKMKSVELNPALLDKLMGTKDLKFDTVFDGSERKDSIRNYLPTLPELNSRTSLMRYAY